MLVSETVVFKIILKLDQRRYETVARLTDGISAARIGLGY